ncbi:MAG: AAA family ATPase [Wenzhouxiangella sp.]|jgi:MoxR-like ATPase|nr:AAA family ATPase [Wenzhouxiangella sp.]
MSARSRPALQRIPAEQLHADELQRLNDWDQHPRPPGWRLSPRAVEMFVLGDESLGIARKFVAEPGVVNRTVVSLCTDLGALLAGPPGTAKSWLSELLAAAICGDSTLSVQGGSVESIGQLIYSWNEALVRRSGPTPEAVVPGALMRAMREGRILRFEELARCHQHLQDALLSVLSDRVVTIPELGEAGVVHSVAGFNIIATSNDVDVGIYQMSAALKRRLNFERILPIRRIEDEIDVVRNELIKRNGQAGLEVEITDEVLEVLVTVFHELRNGQTLDGRSTDRLAASFMSTAEAVNAAHAACAHAFYYGDGAMTVAKLLHFILGTALKDDPEDRRRLHHYFETEVARKTGDHWQKAYAQRHLISLR